MAEHTAPALPSYAVRVMIAVTLAVSIVALLALLWLAVDMLLLAFAGLLFAVFLRGLSDWLSRHVHVGSGLALLLTIIVLLCLVGTLSWFSASRIIEQAHTLAATIPTSLENLHQQLMRYQWGDWVVKEAQGINWKARGMYLLGRMSGALFSVFGIIVDVVVIGFLGLYLAAQPQTYIRGAVRLAPVAARPRMRQVLSTMGHTLRWWLVGILVGMTVIGLMSGIGLWLIGVPFALVLGLMAGVLSFVPYLGALVSAIPALLVAFVKGPEYALYVAGLYLAIHLVEGYLLNPLIQQRAVSLPPALLLFAQIMLGLLLGIFGVILAAPIAACVMVAVKMIYIEDILGENLQ